MIQFQCYFLYTYYIQKNLYKFVTKIEDFVQKIIVFMFKKKNLGIRVGVYKLFVINGMKKKKD